MFRLVTTAPTLLATATLPASCATPPGTAGTGTPQEKSSWSKTCQPGWVCGVCPDGTWWGYLNDPKYTNDPQLSHLYFDDRNPCG